MSKSHIAAGVFILDALSTCWGYEMNYAPERIAAGVELGGQFLHYLDELGGA